MNPQQQAAYHVLDQLELAGFDAYLVGGCVRDELLGRKPKDMDICTQATPEQIQQLFPSTVPTGIEHGTVTVIHERIPIEVTTFRVESEYENHRKPRSVAFVTRIEEDLARRDFTINAIAQNRRGQVTDPFGGRTDLQQRRIVCVGDPKLRFEEDALRMIRAARFAAQLEFTIDPTTVEGIQNKRKKLQYLSMERIYAELNKLFQCELTVKGITVFFQYDLFHYLPIFDKWTWRTTHKQAIETFDYTDDRLVRWAYLLKLGQISVDQCGRTCQQLCISRKDTIQIVSSVRLAPLWSEAINDEQEVLLLLSDGLVANMRAYQLSQMMQCQRPDLERLNQIRHKWEELPVRSITDLAINGKELQQALQKPPGAWIGKCLDYLLIQVALGRVPNQQQILLKEGCQFEAEHS